MIGTRALFNWGGGVLFTFCLYATTGTEQPIPGTIDEMAGRGSIFRSVFFVAVFGQIRALKFSSISLSWKMKIYLVSDIFDRV